MKKLAISLLTVFSAGCAVTPLGDSATPHYDAKFGDSVREAKLKMTIDPNAGKTPDPVAGVDGKAGKITIERYQNSFKEPPPVVPVINIGGSFGSGK